MAMLQLLLSALVCVEYLKDVNCSPLRGADPALTEDGLIETNPETVDELTNTYHAFTEGDLILNFNRNAVDRKWPDVKGQSSLPYLISPELASRRDDILSAMAMVSEHTCVSFHDQTDEPDYLVFKFSPGCASFVGFVGGAQTVFVGPSCIVGNICHEILHALGFHHENTRTDRDKYIIILPHNIMEGMERNFQEQSGDTLSLPYDIGSILHYGRAYFSKTGFPTLVPKENVEDMGQRTHMTEVDVQRVRLFYNCDGKENVPDDRNQQDGTRRTSFWSQDDAAGQTTGEGHSSATLDLSQDGSLGTFKQLSGPSATNSTSGFNQSHVSASPQLEEGIASASPSPMMQLSMATTRGHNDTSTVEAEAQS